MPNRFYSIERSRKPKQLPNVLSKEEILKLIEYTNNLKHKCIIGLLYSSGVRRGELLNLLVTDIDSKRMMVHIKNAKGNKDRYSVLSLSIFKDLKAYYKEYRPTKYLFEGPNGNKYSVTSVLRIIDSAAIKAGIEKKITLIYLGIVLRPIY